MNQAVPVEAHPPGSIPVRDFYRQDSRRSTSRTLAYGSGWLQQGWTGDTTHMIDLYWLGATHELAAFYVRYDWSQVDPAELTMSASEIPGGDFGSGVEVGHLLRVLGEASAEIYVEVLAQLDSALQCHELMFGWQWLQHHPDGFSHIRTRVRDRLYRPQPASAGPTGASRPAPG